MMPTEEELKDPWVAQLFLKNPKGVPQLLPKPSVPRSRAVPIAEWQEFKEEIRAQVDSINKSIRVLQRDQKKSNKLLQRVINMLKDNVHQQGHGKAQLGTPSTSTQPINIPTNASDALKTPSDDIEVTTDVGVQAAMEFLTGDKVIGSHQHVEEESNKVSLYRVYHI